MNNPVLDEQAKPRLVFDFVRPPTKKLLEVDNGEAPRESLLGYVQLRERGWPLSASDDRWHGRLGAIRQKLLFTAEIPSFKMVAAWKAADVVVVTTRISFILALVAKLLNKKIVFLDAMCEEVPKRLWRRLPIKWALGMADACIGLSRSQAHHWAERLNVPESVFSPVNYGIDAGFYKRSDDCSAHGDVKPYMLAVGRDPRRDFDTLVEAAKTLGWELKLVTPAYLVPKSVSSSGCVHVFDSLPYDELFELYANARCAVIPIRRDTTYMSGIRATMEAMLLGCPVVASRTPGMEDYFTGGEDVIYFEPERSDDLVSAIRRLIEDAELRERLTKNAKSKVVQSYSVSNYADALEKILGALSAKPA